MEVGHLKLRPCAFSDHLLIPLISGANQPSGWFVISDVFCNCDRYWLKVLPGLQVALHSWAVSAVGGKAGLERRAQKRIYLAIPDRTDGGFDGPE